MKKLFTCEIHYFQSPWLTQIYDGFEKLRKAGIIDVTYKKSKGIESKPILKVIVDNKFTIIYDTIDGLHWFGNSIDEKLNHFKNDTTADYYFKRSFKKELLDHAPDNCQIFPLGLNYPLNNEGKNKTIKELVMNSALFKFIKPHHERYPSELFESLPIYNKSNNILFFAQLWDPDDVKDNNSKLERDEINKNRINIIRACKNEFGELFNGGLLKNKFSVKHCKDLIAPQKTTLKINYLNAVKASNICISTTGLHGSIGWQLGEYVAASRAVISMPLNYELPGTFNEGENYLSYTNENELIEKIYFLLKNKDVQFEIMRNNYRYYNTFLRPDAMVLNTLLILHNDINYVT